MLGKVTIFTHLQLSALTQSIHKQHNAQDHRTRYKCAAYRNGQQNCNKTIIKPKPMTILYSQ